MKNYLVLLRIKSREFCKNRTGFSLIEILIVSAVASLIVLMASNFSSTLGNLQNLVSQQLQSHSDIDQTLQIMTTEIRSAAPSAAGAYPIDWANTSSFAFYSDINQNGAPEHVRYFFATSTVQKGVITPSGNPPSYPTSTEIITTVVNNLTVTSTPLFTYFGSSYTGIQPALTSTVDVSQIRIVQVNFYADINPSKAPQMLFFSDTINIRNLRSN